MSENTPVKQEEANSHLPDYLRNEEIQGVDEIRQIVRPPVIKIIQKQSDDALLDKFEKGDAIIRPGDALLLAHKGPDGNPTPMIFTPLYFYREYIQVTPIEAPDNVPSVLSRTTDSKSELARKAGNKDLWYEEVDYDTGNGIIKVKVRNIEILNYIIVVHNHVLGGDPMVLPFAKGEYRTGADFAARIKNRKASIFDCVFEARVCKTPRSSPGGTWFGFDIINPDDVSPWVTDEQHKQFKAMHEELAEMHSSGLIQVDLDEEQPSQKEDSDGEF